MGQLRIFLIVWSAGESGPADWQQPHSCANEFERGRREMQWEEEEEKSPFGLVEASWRSACEWVWAALAVTPALFLHSEGQRHRERGRSAWAVTQSTKQKFRDNSWGTSQLRTAWCGPLGLQFGEWCGQSLWMREGKNIFLSHGLYVCLSFTALLITMEAKAMEHFNCAQRGRGESHGCSRRHFKKTCLQSWLVLLYFCNLKYIEAGRNSGLTLSDVWSLVMVIGYPFSRCNRHVCHLQQV